MLPIVLPFKERSFKIRQVDAYKEIWDVCRKRYVILTPEEWIRQHVIHLLIDDYQVPRGMISVEKRVHIGRVSKRYDIVVYDRTLNPFLLVECKASGVAITEDAIRQISHYQKELQSVHLLLTNGSYSFLGAIKDNRWQWLQEMPAYALD